MRKLTLFILLLASTAIFAQKTEVSFSGKVLDNETLEAIADVHIQVNQAKIGLSNTDGKFSYLLHVGDTLQFSHVSYKDAQLIVSDSLVQGNYLIGVYLSKDTLQITEVIIFPHQFQEQSVMFKDEETRQKELLNAKNNLRLSSYIAVTQRPTEMDAEMHADLAMQKFQVSAENKGLIPPDQLISFNPITAMSLIYGLIITLAEPQEPVRFEMTKKDEDLLKIYYEELRKQKGLKK